MEYKSKIMLAGAMFIYGTIGLFRKYIPWPSSTLACARGFIGMFSLLGLLLLKKTRLSRKAIEKNLVLLLLSGGFIGINWILLFEAYRYTSISVATLCYYMAPIFVIIASPFFLKERLSFPKIACVGTALIGMILVSGVLENSVTGVRGILLGLGAAVLYASVILLNKKIHDISAYDKTILQLGSAAIVVLPYVFLTGNHIGLALSPLVILMVLFVGIVHTGIAYALYFGSMEHLKAQTIALYSYIDPILAILLSALLLHESMSGIEILGAVLVLGSTFISDLVA